MATWVVGDVQGCFTTLRRLLARIRYRQGRDRIGFVGDLVNRGPDSLGVLRWARDQGDSVACVLGNHDLHLLARREGVTAPRKDTLAPVLDAPDADELCDWLAALPFVHEEEGFLLVHAGFLPGWGLADIERAASEARNALRRDRRGFLASLYALRNAASSERGGADALAASVFTRLRIVDAGGQPAFDFDGPPEAIPAGHGPWFEAASLPAGRTVLFGHWAALGLMVSERAVCLDSGCVWEGSLTAMRLEDGALAIEPAARGDGRPL